MILILSFEDSLAKKHRKKYGEKITGVDKELTVSLIASFGMEFTVCVLFTFL